MKLSFATFGYALAFLLIASYGFFTLRGPKGIPALLEKERQVQQMEKRNGALAQENERLREHIQRLNDDPAEQEMEIRSRLKLVRPGEKVYILNNK